MIIAIDGPAGAGKSTVARLLAQRLGYQYIETGAMYRAVALLALRHGVALSDSPALEKLAGNSAMRFVFSTEGNRLLLDGEDVTDAIRKPDVTGAASVVSAVAGVRRVLVERQRELGREDNIIMEGRDIGTKVFPDAPVKVFLDAHAEVRGQRRLLQEGLPEDGKSGGLEQAISEMGRRDRRDRERTESPLVQAPDALYIDSSTKSITEVVEQILQLIESKQPEVQSPQSE